MQTYEKYKDSGVAWIGEIPYHWDVVSLKRSLRIKNGCDYKTIQVDEGGYPVIGSGGEFARASKYLYDGEVVLLGRKGTIDKPLYYEGQFWVVDTMFYGIPLNNCFGKYLYFQSRTIPFNRYSTNTALPSMTQTDLNSHSICLPTFAEQQCIASYLDKKCANIDKVISTQRSRIELLQELKQSTITHAVTHGLNSNVKMKDSGVEWIGEVPEHWEIKRMRFLCKMETGSKDTINKEDDGKYPFFVRSPKIERINTYSFDGESILMAGDGVGAGKVIHYYNGKFDYHQRVYNFHHYKEIKTKLAFYYIQSNFKYIIEEGGAKNTVDSVRLPWLKDFPICIPSAEEQDLILSFVENNSQKYDNSISKAQKEIDLLQEYKQALVTEVVTGKRKVC